MEMVSIEQNHDYDLTQLLLSPEQENITLIMPEDEQANADLSRKRKSSSDLDPGKHVKENESPADYKKRMDHRDAERKRRQATAILYASLRSKLPEKYAQGKSISSDMQGAVDYINHLKGNIGGLKKRRDELKKMLQEDAGSSSSTFNHEQTSVKVECGKNGIQVILKTSSTKGFPLSKLLSILNCEGMPAVNCTSTRANETLIHVIYCEIDSEGSFDQTELEKRLGDLVNAALVK